MSTDADLSDRVRRFRRRAGSAIAMLGGGRQRADRRAEGPRVIAWQARAEWPLALLALLYLGAYTAQVLGHHFDAQWRTGINVLLWTVWALFGIEFLVRVFLARRHVRYAWRHLVDVGMIALPVLRPLRILRVLMLMRTINRRMAESMRGRVVIYGGFTAALLIYCASLAVYQAERGAKGANIQSFWDAIWWSVVTICTVGYGDKFPVTVEGRCIGIGLMVAGVGLFGVVTAAFAAWLVDQLRDEEAANQQATRADLLALREQLNRIEARLDALGPTPAPRAQSRRRRKPPD